MIRLTDMTIRCLDGYDPSSEQLRLLIELLTQLGIKQLEISREAFQKLGGVLPPQGKYILRCDEECQPRDYPHFSTFVGRYGSIDCMPNAIQEIQINDIREVHLLRRYGDLDNVRLTGLDDFLLHDYAASFETLRQTFKGRVQLCPQDRYYCATALTVEWLMSGGEETAVSFAGLGGFAALEEVFMALRLENRRGLGVNFTVLPQLRDLVEAITGEPIPTNKPLIGKNIFHVEAGIHVDGIIKSPQVYEPFKPDMVGNARKFVVGKHSGRAAIRLKIKELALKQLDDSAIAKLLAYVRRESVSNQRSLTDEEFSKLYGEITPMAEKGGDCSEE